MVLASGTATNSSKITGSARSAKRDARFYFNDFLYREEEEYMSCILGTCVTINENNSSMKKLSTSIS